MADAPRTGRRTFLKLGLVGSGLLAVGGGLAAWFSRGYESYLSADDRPIALSTKEYAVVVQLVEALLPASDGFPSGVSLRVPQRVDEELWAASEKQRTPIRQGLELLEHLPLAKGRRSRFTRLPAPEREAFFEELLASDVDAFRQLSLALRQLVHLAYYGHERTWRAMRYEGPLGIPEKPPVSHVHYESLLRGSRRSS